MNKCASFIEIVQAIKLNSISRARLNFRRRPILCTTLYRNLMQASNFGGTFDQLFLWIFYEIFTEYASLLLLYHGAKMSKMTKNSNQGGPALKISGCTKISCVQKVGGPQHTKIECVRNILDLQYMNISVHWMWPVILPWQTLKYGVPYYYAHVLLRLKIDHKSWKF